MTGQTREIQVPCYYVMGIGQRILPPVGEDGARGWRLVGGSVWSPHPPPLSSPHVTLVRIFNFHCHLCMSYVPCYLQIVSFNFHIIYYVIHMSFSTLYVSFIAYFQNTQSNVQMGFPISKICSPFCLIANWQISIFIIDFQSSFSFQIYKSAGKKWFGS